MAAPGQLCDNLRSGGGSEVSPTAVELDRQPPLHALSNFMREHAQASPLSECLPSKLKNCVEKS